jgi:DNA-directed RNA polymerase subunit RPC12/RpoP
MVLWRSVVTPGAAIAHRNILKISMPSHQSRPMPSKASSGGVVCVQCAQKISIETAAKVSEEFSILCSKCGKRAFYRIKDLKTLKVS